MVSGFSEVGQSRQIKFKSSRVGYSVDGIGSIFKTTDNGSTWIKVNNTSGSNQYELTAIDWQSNSGVAVGDYAIVISKDNGQSWEFKKNSAGESSIQTLLKDVHLQNETSAIVCGQAGCFYKIQF